MSVVHHEQHRRTHGRNTGECSLWRLSRAPSSAARKDVQGRPRKRAGFLPNGPSLTRGFIVVLPKLGRGLRAPVLSLSRVARVVSFHAAEPVRHVLRRDRRLVLTHAGTGRFFPCAGARQSCRAHLPQTIRIKASLLKPVAEPSHLERLSLSLVYGTHHSEEATHAAGSITQGLGNVL